MPRSYARPFLPLVVAVFAFAGFTSPANAQHHRGDPKRVQREQIEALEQQWHDAQVNDDVAAMDKLLSDDFLGITANGEVNTKQQYLDRLRNRVATITSLQMSDVKIKLLGGAAIVTSQAEITGTAQGVPLDGKVRYTRVYQRLPGGVWKITNFASTRIPKGNGRRGEPSPPPAQTAPPAQP